MEKHSFLLKFHRDIICLLRPTSNTRNNSNFILSGFLLLLWFTKKFVTFKIWSQNAFHKKYWTYKHFEDHLNIGKLHKMSLTSICWTVRSRKVRSLRTLMMLLGPLHPMLVPRPPFSLTTTSLLSSALMAFVSGDCSSLYVLTCQSTITRIAILPGIRILFKALLFQNRQFSLIRY